MRWLATWMEKEMGMFLVILYDVEEEGKELDKNSYEDCLALPVLTYSPILPLPADAVRPQPLPQHHIPPSCWPNMTWRW